MNILNIKYLILSLVFLLLFSSNYNIINAQEETNLSSKELRDRYVRFRDSAYLVRLSSPDSSLMFSLKALKLAKQINEPSNIGYSYLLIGNANMRLGKYSEALNSLKLAEKNMIIADCKSQLHSIYNNMSSIYRTLNEEELAIKYCSKSLNIAIELNDYQSIIESKISFGNIFTIREEFDTANKYYISALEDSKTNDSLKKNISTIYNNIGYTHFCKREFKAAKLSFSESYKISKESRDYLKMAVSLKNLAEIELINENYIYAEKLINEADNINQKHKYIESSIGLYHTAYEVYNRNKKYESAIYYLEKYYKLKDSIYNLKLAKELENIRSSYELDKMKKESEIKDISIQHKQKINNIFFAISAGILIFSVILIINILQKHKAHKLVLNRNIILREKDKEIQENLGYAREIQLACMQTMQSKKENIQIIDMPKLIVGGDFYLIRVLEGKSYYILSDCTGHGSSAGFLSILGIQFLNFAISNNYSLSEIVSFLNTQFYNYISKSNSLKNESMSICIICLEDKHLSFCGSGQRFWIFNSKNKEIEEYKTDRHSIGRQRDYKFTTKQMQISIGDKIILSSDGFPDQFNETQSSKLKYPKFRDLILNSCCMELKEGKAYLIDELEKWKGSAEQTDDILLMTIEIYDEQ